MFPLTTVFPVMVTLFANVEFPVTSMPAVKSWFPVDVIGPSLATATEALPFSMVVLSTAVVEVFVIRPFALTVIIGIAVDEPTVPADTPEFAKLLLASAVFNVTVPATVKLSSTVTVPPAESIVRFPDPVSISLSPVSPT